MLKVAIRAAYGEEASRYAKKIYRCCDRVRGIEIGAIRGKLFATAV